MKIILNTGTLYNIILSLICFCLCVCSVNGQMQSSTVNYTHFSLLPEKNITTELESLTPEKWKTHPDYGQLPHYAPCNNCVELIHQRTDSTRYFIENNTNGKKVYLQTGDHTMHFRDDNGFIRERLNILFPTQTPHVFKTKYLPEQVEINVPNEQVAIHINDGQTVTFNKNLELWAVTSDNKQILLNKATWKNGYTAGQNGTQVKEIFPNVDMEINILQEGIKTNFVVKNNNTNFKKYRYIFIKDDFLSEQATNISFLGTPNADKLYASNAIIYNAENKSIAAVEKGVVFDSKQSIQKEVFYEWKNGFNIYVETDIFNAPNVVYPIVIDPTVQLTSTLVGSAITTSMGSKYNATCWNPNEYCSYPLNVNFPANATFTNVIVKMGIYAPWQSSVCPFTGGAFRVVTGDCIAPNSGGTEEDPDFWECASLPNVNPMTHNICFLGDNGSSVINSLGSCLPTPACTTQTQQFHFQLFRCVQNGSGCGSQGSCIVLYGPAIVTVVGETIQLPSISIEGGTTNSTICKGDTIGIKSNDNYGVPPYTYLWQPGGETTDSIIVSPQLATTYSVTVTDSCGNTANSSQLVTVVPLSHDTTTKVICENNLPYVWTDAWNEQTITSAGEHTLTDSNIVLGCKSTKTMYLTVHPAAIKIDSTICDDQLPYTWQTHTVNDIGQHVLSDEITIQGCKVGTTINLNVNPVIRINIDSIECVTEFPFEWNGQFVNETGNFILIDTNIATNGCDSITTLYLFIQCDVEVPNIVSLSSTLGNQVWSIKDGNFTEFSCLIMNRWGQIVYELTDVKQTWSGQNKNGDKVSEGVYFYNLKVKYKDGKEVTKHGTVHVAY